MDLLEIRKKAKQKKEAEEKAAIEAPAHAPDDTPEHGEAVPPEGTPDRKPSFSAGKRTGKKVAKGRPAKAGAKTRGRAKSGKKPPVPEMEPQAAPAEAPPAGPSPDETASGGGGQAPESDFSPSVQEDVVAQGDEAPEAGGNIIEYLAFMLADEEYAVRVENVKEIIRLQRITRVPRAEDFVEGIISLRGVIIPVFDIKKRLGLEPGERQRTVRIVIVSEQGSPQGIIVDRVTGVARLLEDAIEPPPAVIGGIEAEYLEGVGRIGDRLLILFNTDKVLSMDGGAAG